MKKIILFLFLFFNILYCLGQSTFTMNLNYSSSSGPCSSGSASWSISGNGGLSDSGSGLDKNISKTYSTTSILNTLFNLSLNTSCNGSFVCNKNQTISVTTIDLLKTGGVTSSGGCNATLSLNNFVPNGLTIKNLDPTKTTVCSGEQLQLAGFPIDFPNEAYHWQYSLDNQVTWIDAPSTLNDKNQSTFSINDLLLDSYKDLFDQIIHFRLGYTQNRPFSNVLSITYLSCGPAIENVTYENPKCNGDNVSNITVTFKRDLYTNLSEELSPLYLENIADGNMQLLSQPVISSFTLDPIDNKYKYTFVKLGQLPNNVTFKIKYQAQIKNNKDLANPIKRGVFESPKILDFTYIDPKAFYFTATATPAICNGAKGAKGAIEILAWGGSGTYKYQLDGGTETAFPNPAIFDQIETTKQKIVVNNVSSIQNTNPNIQTNHSIKVTDSNGCIDTEKND
jgi:hypothetical protein